MSKIIRINAKTDEATGFGTNSTMYGGRLMKKDGQPNIRKTNISFMERFSWYHTMIRLSSWKFLGLIFLCFLVGNLLFGLIYLAVGVEHLGGMEARTPSQKFIEAYFFSAQTFTTVGYGRINPTGYLTSFIAAFEAFCGLLFFAIATGLFYARFSRPQAFLKFSHNALVSPFKDGIALMFRLVPYKNNYLTDAEVQVTLALIMEENGLKQNLFYQLELQLAKINALSLSWTLVHPITEKSPLYNLSSEDLKNYKAEVMVFVKAFDDTFSNTVVARTSYSFREVIFGAKFQPMYNRSVDGTSTIMEMDKLHTFVKVDISAINAVKQSAEK